MERKRRVVLWIAGVLAALLVLPYLYPLSAYDPGRLDLPAGGRLLDAGGTQVHIRTWLADTKDMELPSLHLMGRILLVHGFGGSTANWEAVAPRLAERGYAVVAADVPGFGYSDKRIDAATYSHERNAAALWTAIDALAAKNAVFEGPWILVGHSMGGAVVTRMSGLRREATERVVLVDGAVSADGSDEGGPPALVRSLLGFPPAGRAAADVLDLLLRFPAALRGPLSSAYGRTPTDAEIASYAKPLQVAGTARALLAITRSGASDDGGELQKILIEQGVPVSLIWGTEDAWIPIAQGEALSRLFGVPLHRIEGAGHCPMETHPEEVLDAFASIAAEGAAP